MRGLTDEERAYLLEVSPIGPVEWDCGLISDAESVVSVRLTARGLLCEQRLTRGDEWAVFDFITPLGELALRCDTAARGLP